MSIDNKEVIRQDLIKLVLRCLAGLLAIGLLIWTLLSPGLRNAEGGPTGRICLPIAGIVALIVIAVTVTSRWAAFGCWFSVALMGQAASLQMIDAGTRIHYQHYRLPSELLHNQGLVPLAILVAQSILVVWICLRDWVAIRKWLHRSSAKWKLFLAIVFVSLISAPLSRHVPTYLAELPMAAFIQIIQLATIVIMAASFPTDILASKSFSFLNNPVEDESTTVLQATSIDRFALLGAAWFIVLTSVLAVFSYQSHPHIQDEVSHFIQAQHFSHGALSAPPPPSQEGFSNYLLQIEEDRWFGVTPPAYPALLGIGMLAGVPWLVNSLLGGLNVILVSCLVMKLYGRRISRMVVLLLCLSPWALLLAMSFMNHTLAMTCTVFAAWAIIRARRTDRIAWGFAAGSAIGVLSLVRQLEAVIVAGLLGIWSLGLGGRRLKTKVIIGLMAGTALIGAINLPYNAHLTDHPIKSPLMEYVNTRFGPNANRLGFGPDRGAPWPLDPYPGHGLRDVIVNTNLNLFSVNVELLGWSVGSLLLAVIALLMGRRQHSDRLMFVVILTVIGFYSCYWYSGGPDFGARYWYLILIPALVLTARGAEVLTDSFCETDTDSRAKFHRRVEIAILSLCLMTAINYIPWRAIDKYYHYLGMRPDVRRLAKQHDFGRSLVLIRGEEHPDYASAIVYNPVNLQAQSPIYAWDRSQKVREELLRSYSDRPIWIINGPSITGRGFEIVDGPIPPGSLK